MFTGIVSGTGEVVRVERGSDSARLWVDTAVLGPRDVGASVAVDGVCLTVTGCEDGVSCFDVSAESLARSTLGDRRSGDLVNLEAPLRAGDELGGHIVQGHVDAVGHVTGIDREPGGVRLRVSLPPELGRYVVEKGSVTVDGVSLTVADVSDDEFAVAVVPHTLEVTTFGTYEVSRAVNLELDMIGKYVERLTDPWRTSPPESSGYL